MTPAEFVAKWKHVALTERSSSQTHFIDLCRLVGHPDPVAADPTGAWFTFERGATKATGGEGWADVWKKGSFGWEYKGRHRDLDAAYLQLLKYQGALENPPLLVTCDTDRILIHTHFSNTPTRTIELTVEGLTEPDQLATLRAVFREPERLRPEVTIQAITEEAAAAITTIAQALRGREIPAERVARYLDRVVFCLFAEDVGLLPSKVFTRVVENTQDDPDRFRLLVGNLFDEMASGGHFGADTIEHFNGDLFEGTEALELTRYELRDLLKVSQLDWSNIDASIFGTLFERALDPDKRSQLGAHYTGREDIEQIVDPVVVQPLQREWMPIRAQFDTLVTGSVVAGTRDARKWRQARGLIRGFLERLASVTVLDPACGSGNFLFVTLQKLKDLEKEVIVHASSYFPFFPQVGPWQLRGIEVNAYAHELAQMTVWIGHLQWHSRHGMPLHERPILRRMTNFERKDAVLSLDRGASEPEWPDAEFIVSNPPFLGGKRLRDSLGDEYVEALFSAWEGRVPAEADYCCYWFEKARARVEAGRTQRVGLLATQGIRSGANREVLRRIKDTGNIFFAVSDQEWVLDGATVHVSMVAFDNGTETTAVLDGGTVPGINADLTSGADVTRAAPLTSNANRSFQGPVKVGDFDIGFAVAAAMLTAPNPHGKPNSDVVRPWVNGKGLTGRDPHKFIIDFNARERPEAALYELPFAHVEAHVKPERLANRDAQRRRRWWMLGRLGTDLRAATRGLCRMAGTPRVSKHRVFTWLGPEFLPDTMVVTFAIEDDYTFGILHSAIHEAWARALGSQLREEESGFRYTPRTTFETFPFPDTTDAQQREVAAAAKQLTAVRGQWLNPPEWVQPETLTFRATVDGPWAPLVKEADADGVGTAQYTRLLPVDESAEKALRKRTLTDLYNEPPSWLRDLHSELDRAVFAAYGLAADSSESAILTDLVVRNFNAVEHE